MSPTRYGAVGCLLSAPAVAVLEIGSPGAIQNGESEISNFWDMFPSLFQITNVSDDAPWKTCLGDAMGVQWASLKSGRHGV